ncbi:MAG: hypothetical protein QE263_03105 [Vampirovibrionales bacterium]|nr:hypothetical protein [Vampirovibrionales bacterium]
MGFLWLELIPEQLPWLLKRELRGIVFHPHQSKHVAEKPDPFCESLKESWVFLPNLPTPPKPTTPSAMGRVTRVNVTPDMVLKPWSEQPQRMIEKFEEKFARITKNIDLSGKFISTVYEKEHSYRWVSQVSGGVTTQDYRYYVKSATQNRQSGVLLAACTNHKGLSTYPKKVTAHFIPNMFIVPQQVKKAETPQHIEFEIPK